MIDDRLPPYDLDAEESVLGSILLDSDAMNMIADKLSYQDFYRDKNQWVYNACVSLHKRKEAVNAITIAHELGRHDKLEPLGGKEYLSNLLYNVPTSVHIEYYADIVKRLSIARELILSSEKIAGIGYSAPVNAEEAVSQAQLEIMRVANLSKSANGYKTLDEVGDEVFAENIDLFESNFIPGLSSGFLNIDKVFGGYQKRKLYIIAARPSVGKTQFMCQQAYRQANKKHNVGIVSLEMPRSEIYNRMLDPLANINRQEMRELMASNRMSMEEKDIYQKRILKAQEDIYGYPIYIDDSSGQTTYKLKSRLFSLLYKHNVDIIFVDHLGWLRDMSNENNVKRLDAITMNLADLAKEANIPIVALCQLNRKVEDREDKRPKLSDLRDSGGIEQNAHVVMGLFRPQMYEEGVEINTDFSVLYLKNRDGQANPNGNYGSYLFYDPTIGLIKEQ